MKEGFIVKCHAGLYTIYSEGKLYPCKARGKLRIEGKSPLAGDEVIFDENENYLMKIKNRKNAFIRPPIANVEQMLIVASLKHPNVSILLILRFVTMALSKGIKPIIAISKIDLLEDDNEELKLLKEVFNNLDYKIIYFSNKLDNGLDEIRNAIHNHKTVITGQSGVGKSSLINKLLPGLALDTNEISIALGRGKHTTKVVEYMKYDDSSWIADSPGFSLIDLELTPVELSKFYPGFENYFNECKFNDCLHDNESKCAIKKAVEENKISLESYKVYLKLLHELQSKKERY